MGDSDLFFAAPVLIGLAALGGLFVLTRRRRDDLWLDDGTGSPEIAALRAQLQAGSFEASHAAVSAASADYDRKAWLVETLSTWKGRPAWIDAWAMAHPDSEVPLLMRGAHSFKWAWEERGMGKASDVPKSRWPIYEQRLESAMADLNRASELAPDDPLPWALMVSIARCAGMAADESLAAFDEADRRCPWHFRAHLEMLVSTCAKWTGSHELMFGFARSRTADCPEGSMVPALVAAAHFERRFYLEAWEGNPAHASYLRSPDVVAEIRSAWEKCFDSPDFRKTALTHEARNLFAAVFYLMGDFKAAHRDFISIGEQITPYPWKFVCGTRGATLRIRRECAAKGN